MIRIFTVCFSICIFWRHFFAIMPICLNFRVITAKISDVPKFRSFTVIILLLRELNMKIVLYNLSFLSGILGNTVYINVMIWMLYMYCVTEGVII